MNIPDYRYDGNFLNENFFTLRKVVDCFRLLDRIEADKDVDSNIRAGDLALFITEMASEILGGMPYADIVELAAAIKEADL